LNDHPTITGYNVDSFGDVGLLVDRPLVIKKNGTRVRLKTLPPFPTDEEITQLNEQHAPPTTSSTTATTNMIDFTKPEAALLLPPDLLVLRWVNFHLRNAGYSKVVENLSGDLQDSEELAVVLAACSKHSECHPNAQKMTMKLRNVDVEARGKFV
jgi:hypothetical protein